MAVVAVEVRAPAMLSAPPKVLVPVVVKDPATVEEACETKPLAKVARPVCMRVPIVAFAEKRLVEEAVVEKSEVVVALVMFAFPVRVRRVPSKVRFPESVS